MITAEGGQCSSFILFPFLNNVKVLISKFNRCFSTKAGVLRCIKRYGTKENKKNTAEANKNLLKPNELLLKYLT